MLPTTTLLVEDDRLPSEGTRLEPADAVFDVIPAANGDEALLSSRR